jgi:hypothetical protein
MDGGGLTEVALVVCHQANACVMSVLMIPSEETAAERAGLIDDFEPFGKPELIFQCLEAGLQKRVGIQGVWTDVGFDPTFPKWHAV